MNPEHDEASIGKFLDYAQERYQESPDSKHPITTERFMKFPSNKMSDIEDTSGELTIPAGHEAAERCPALPAVERGTLVGRIVASNGMVICKPMLVADGGVENFNGAVNGLVESGLLNRVLAQTEITCSNLMIESWWRVLKQQWLFLNTLDSVKTVEALVAFYALIISSLVIW